MKFKSLIFDLDETLLNTLEDIADSANRVLRERGFATHTLNAYRYFVGRGATELMVRALPPGQRDRDLIADCVEAFRVEYRRGWNVRTRTYDGVPELLDTLAGKGARISVLSNKPHEFTVRCIRQYFSGYNFVEVLGEGGGDSPEAQPYRGA